MSTDTQNSTPVSAELVALPQCPFPCGWSGLHKIAVQDAAYLAKVQWPEDEEGVNVPRATAMRSMDYLIQVCRTMLNAAPVAAQAQPSSDRAMLLELMEAFDMEEWNCPNCTATEETKDCDSAIMLRQYLANNHVPAQQPVSEEAQPDLIRFDYVNADGQPDSKMITHDEMRERYAVAVRHAYGQAQQPVSGDDRLSTERVRIDGTTYELPSAVAAELLRLHLEIPGAEQERAALAQQDADKVDAERWRAYRASAAADDAGFLQRALNAIEAMGLEDGQRPSEDQIDAAIDAARKEGGNG